MVYIQHGRGWAMGRSIYGLYMASWSICSIMVYIQHGRGWAMGRGWATGGNRGRAAAGYGPPATAAAEEEEEEDAWRGAARRDGQRV